MSERLKTLPHPALQAQVLPGLPKASAAPATTVSGTAVMPPAEIEERIRAFSLGFKPPKRDDVPEQYRLELLSRVIDTRTCERSRTFKGFVSSRGTCPVIVQFSDPIDDAQRELIVKHRGIERDYIPNQALMVELTEAEFGAIQSSPLVTAAVELEVADKLQPFLKTLTEEDRLVPVTVVGQEDGDNTVIAAAIGRLGGVVTKKGRFVSAQLVPGQAAELARMGEIKWVEVTAPLKTMMERAHITKQLNTSPARDWWGLTGKGQIGAHSDTGIDTGNLSTLHNDLRGRILAIIPLYTGAGPDIGGHGTHTAGLFAGNGAGSGGKYKGSAPEANFYSLAFYESGGYLLGADDVYGTFTQTVASGSRVHTASWGADTYGAYDSTSLLIDEAGWDYPESLPVIAASNAGTDTAPANGVIDADSIGNTGCAKNALTVGATENDRAYNTGGYTTQFWSAWGSKFGTSPISTDYCTRPFDGVNQGMAAYSSRGPTDDGRIKPEITAPGAEVISTRSSLASYYGYALDYPALYAFNTGTSMATPLVAGGALLMRQYAAQYGNITNPTAALVKAMLVGGARSLSPGQYGTGAYREISTNSPNTVEGWGQANFSQSTFPTNGAIRLFDRLSLASRNATVTYSIRVLRAGQPLRIVLCWTDYQASLVSSKKLVNNYDLTVVTPSSTTLYPNGGTAADTVNNTESVIIPSAAAGVYSVTVKLSTMGKQPGSNKAAVYVNGTIDAQPILSHFPKTSYSPVTAPLTVDFQIQTASTNRPRVNYSFGTQAAPTGTWASVDAVCLSNVFYRAQIPALNTTGVVYYAFSLPSTNDLYSTTTNFVSFIGENISLAVFGAPGEYGSVSPAYGTNSVTKDFPLTASAPDFVQVSDTLQAVCRGFTGTGGVPASGTSNTVNFSLSTNASLTWLWGRKYPLVQSFSVPALNYTENIGTDWFDENSNGTTRTTWEVASDGTTHYGLAGWLIDGVRHSANPASGFAMNTPRTAVAEYISFWQDTDGNTLSDWYELRYFGTASGVSATADPDGDGWNNTDEFLDNTDPNNNASVPTPPQIVVHPVDPVQTSRPPWRVSATVTDNFQVAGAELYWWEDGGNLQMTQMQSADGTLFSADLNPPGRGALPVGYFVLAYDLLGYYDYSFYSVSDDYFITADYAQPWTGFSPTDPPPIFTADSLPEPNMTVTVSNYVGPDFVWTARVSSATSRLPADGSGWTAVSPWTLTTNRTPDGAKVWYCGNTTTRQYTNGTYAALQLPDVAVTSQTLLQFTHWMACELDSGTQAWDGGIVQISTNGGTSWSSLVPAGGYPYTIVENVDSPFAANEPCFADTAGEWREEWFDLSEFAGKTVRIRCVFGADGGTTAEGWYVATPVVYEFSGTSPVLMPVTAMGGVLSQQSSVDVQWRVDRSALTAQVQKAFLIAVFGNTPDLLGCFLSVLKGNSVTASATGGGQVSPQGTSVLFAPSNSVTVTAAADFGWHLDRTVSNAVERVSAVGTTNSTFAFTAVSNDIVFLSVFAQNLSPLYGVPEVWLAQYGIYGDLATTELLDSDSDGRLNWEEFLADTNPTDAVSRLTVTAFSPEEIVWAGGVARTQFVQFSPTLSGPWVPVYTNLPPTDVTNRFQLPIPGTGGYYRVLIP